LQADRISRGLGCCGLLAWPADYRSQTSRAPPQGVSPECPAVAIFSEDEVPAEMQEFIQLNVDLAEIWPNITERKDPMPDAAEWDGKKGKIADLER